MDELRLAARFAELDQRCVEIFAADPYYLKRCLPSSAAIQPLR